MGSQPDHHDVFTALTAFCLTAIAECEAELADQKASDKVEAQRLEEEKKRKEEEARLIVEQEEKDRLERIRKREQDRQEIEAAECELEAKKKALCDTEKGADEEDENEDEEGSDSAAEEPVVRPPFYCFVYLFSQT